MRFLLAQCLKNRGLLEKREAENLQDFAEAPLQPEFLLDDGDEHVNADRNPHLSLHRVVACPVKRFDMQVLFDPFEKQLDLPATFVELRDDQSGKLKIVGEEAEALSVFSS